MNAPLRTIVLLCATLLTGAGAVFFGFIYFSLYWPYRHLFNAEGRYLDAQSLVVYDERVGLMGVPMLVCLVAFLLCIACYGVRKRRAAMTRG